MESASRPMSLNASCRVFVCSAPRPVTAESERTERKVSSATSVAWPMTETMAPMAATAIPTGEAKAAMEPERSCDMPPRLSAPAAPAWKASPRLLIGPVTSEPPTPLMLAFSLFAVSVISCMAAVTTSLPCAEKISRTSPSAMLEAHPPTSGDVFAFDFLHGALPVLVDFLHRLGLLKRRPQRERYVEVKRHGAT